MSQFNAAKALADRKAAVRLCLTLVMAESQRNQREVAKAAGLSESTISRWIHKAGDKKSDFSPRFESLQRLAHVAGLVLTLTKGRIHARSAA